MLTLNLFPLVFALVGLVAGIGLLLVRVNPDQLRASSHSMPGVALFRFRAYRYGSAAACFLFAAFAVALSAGFI